MSSTSNDNSRSNTGGGVVFLLLFVGFVLGFSVGFASKDLLVGSLTSQMVSDVEPSAVVPGEKPVVDPATGEGGTDEGAPDEDDSDEGEKEETEEDNAEAPPAEGGE